MICLNGCVDCTKDDEGTLIENPEYQLCFTDNEREIALEIANLWLAKGWMPFLFSKTYNGKFQTLLDFRQRTKKKAA